MGTRNVFVHLVTDENAKKMAVLVNGQTVAEKLGYEDPSETIISHIDVVDGDSIVVFETEVGEGKYLSAIFVEGMFKNRGLSKTEPLIVDGQFRDCLYEYMGEDVCVDACNPALDNHGFVRAILGTDEDLAINVNWK